MKIYNVIKRETELGELDDGEVINAEPLDLVDAVKTAVEVVNHYIGADVHERYRFDGRTPITTEGSVQRWNLRHEQYYERKVVIEVVELQGASRAGAK